MSEFDKLPPNWTVKEKECGCTYVTALDGKELAKPSRITICSLHVAFGKARGERKIAKLQEARRKREKMKREPDLEALIEAVHDYEKGVLTKFEIERLAWDALSLAWHPSVPTIILGDPTSIREKNATAMYHVMMAKEKTKS